MSASESGSYVKVLDLGPLVNTRALSHPQFITDFIAAKHQPISHPVFTHDGNALLVGPKDGQCVSITTTCAYVERDTEVRWAAIGTGKGAVRIFATNPYEGQPDLRGHRDTKIWNVDKPMASSVGTSSGRLDLPSSHSSHRQHNFKDVSGGVLSLRRITLEQRPGESGILFSSPIASLAISISLRGVGAARRLTRSDMRNCRRNEVEASAFTRSSGPHFVEDLAFPSDHLGNFIYMHTAMASSFAGWRMITVREGSRDDSDVAEWGCTAVGPGEDEDVLCFHEEESVVEIA
ncbi:hypothetical protein OG21DRAFT_1527152 [Imleria badia]|nr:hypothetical protein OG21DRAFT_1527152 [Imleria badia]